jgi:hypothetical protein
MSIEYVQPPLLPQPRFEPLPHGEGHYVAVLQNLPGELRALGHASAEVWERMTPLIQVVGPRARRGPLKADRVGRWASRVHDAVGQNACYVDVVRLRPQELTAEPHPRPVLQHLFAEMRRRGILFVPVLPTGAGREHLALVRAATTTDCRGAAIRYGIGAAVPATGASHADVLAGWLWELQLPVTEIDLLLDLDWIGPEVMIAVDDVAGIVEQAWSVGDWRHVVLVGTSMPTSLGDVVPEGTTGFLPRQEWSTWRGLAARGIPITFGDYAIQNPRPPEESGPGMRANIRYTIAEATLIARGLGPVVQSGNEQYRELCQRLVGSGAFVDPDYSWGDRVIHDCAFGQREPSNQIMWRAAGTSHHLQFVVDQLRGVGTS